MSASETLLEIRMLLRMLANQQLLTRTRVLISSRGLRLRHEDLVLRLWLCRTWTAGRGSLCRVTIIGIRIESVDITASRPRPCLPCKHIASSWRAPADSPASKRRRPSCGSTSTNENEPELPACCFPPRPPYHVDRGAYPQTQYRLYPRKSS